MPSFKLIYTLIIYTYFTLILNFCPVFTWFLFDLYPPAPPPDLHLIYV